MKKAIIITRSMNDFLYERFKKTCTLGFDMIQAKGFNTPSQSTDFLFYCFSFYKEYEWIINIDEDAFIINNDILNELISEMSQYDFCGMSDGGSCLIRFHNPIAMNPFFNIFSNKLCEAYCINETKVRQTAFQEDLKKFTPRIKQGYEYAYDNFEPFYSVFFWPLLNNFRPLYLDSYEHIDNTSTILKFNDKIFLGHTWYSREYYRQKDRIDACFNYFMGDKT